MRRTRPIKIPTTGVSDFDTLIRDEEAKYVDKTALLYELARHKADAQLFISRPRRFGKSLMLSTLKAMFEGRRKLFKGLALDKLPWEGWKVKHPVYSFTMGDVSGETYDDVKEQLEKRDWTWTTQNGVKGYVVRGRGDYASNSIFLPCVGFGNGTSLTVSGSYGGYWSSVPGSNGSYDSWNLGFNSRVHVTDANDRWGGRTVRPVQGFAK